jgi:hypothetical protein
LIEAEGVVLIDRHFVLDVRVVRELVVDDTEEGIRAHQHVEAWCDVKLAA